MNLLIIILVAAAAQNAMSAGYTSLTKEATRPIVEVATPFAVTPKDRGLREAVWIEPKLIAEVVFTEWTSDGSIRPSVISGTARGQEGQGRHPRAAECCSNGGEETKAGADRNY